MNLIKILCITLGTLSLLIGLAGIVTPGLPTTPFLLLTAALYIKGSDKLYQRLVSNRLFGPYLLAYKQNPGIPVRTKVFAIFLMWTMMVLSCLFFLQLLSLKLMIIVAGIVGTLVLIFVIPTVKRDN